MPHRARAAWLLAAAQAASAFYLPGVAPREYGPGERVELKVGRRRRPPGGLSTTLHQARAAAGGAGEQQQTSRAEVDWAKSERRLTTRATLR